MPAIQMHQVEAEKYFFLLKGKSSWLTKEK